MKHNLPEEQSLGKLDSATTKVTEEPQKVKKRKLKGVPAVSPSVVAKKPDKRLNLSFTEDEVLQNGKTLSSSTSNLDRSKPTILHSKSKIPYQQYKVEESHE